MIELVVAALNGSRAAGRGPQPFGQPRRNHATPAGACVDSGDASEVRSSAVE